ncbi:class I SAM-dependent RNA methyltransferase [Gordonia phthalatica]|uniref:SAM-dependent methyltransferase n=1 Tax=Gordonia phthalatica TaxID=1136941 RepID=A0A0N9MQN3_9ACTN|nr:TRAM domain-containing protein [Gordonia phthalatica]ALG84670.1 SAM-dependent methyltransferase [Gordonia phthalatica]
MTGTDGLVELEVTGYANGGAGIARSGGRVVFVDGALPGETVLAAITDDKHAAYARAYAEKIVVASEHRVESACPAAAAGAGCCDLSHVTGEHARELGASALADVLRRIGGFSLDELPAPAVEALAPESTGWRIRTRLAVGRDGRAGLRGRRSSTIITEPCAAPVAGLLDDVDALGAKPGTELVLMSGADGDRHAGELEVLATGGGRSGNQRGGRRRNAQRSRGARSGPRALRNLEGDDLVTHRVGDRSWEVPVTGFWQAHRNAPKTYVDAAVTMLAGVGVTGRVHAWDLYGGAGVFTASILDRGPAHGFEVTGVDLVDTDPGALAAAEVTLADDAVRIHRGAVASTLPGLEHAQIVVSDPPRSGSGLAVVDAIAAAGPDAVVHVGCDAASFARDLGRFAASGYRVRAWRAFDAFPMTHHIEAIAVLTR